MENKITDLHSLHLEKQRLKMMCAGQEKEIIEQFKLTKQKLNPSYILKEAMLEIVPKDLRNNRIVHFITDYISNRNQGGVTGEIINLAKTVALPLAVKYIGKLINREKEK